MIPLGTKKKQKTKARRITELEMRCDKIEDSLKAIQDSAPTGGAGEVKAEGKTVEGFDSPSATTVRPPSADTASKDTSAIQECGCPRSRHLAFCSRKESQTDHLAVAIAEAVAKLSFCGKCLSENYHEIGAVWAAVRAAAAAPTDCEVGHGRHATCTLCRADAPNEVPKAGRPID